MTTYQAIAAAKHWVRTQAAAMPGYCGAYLNGSVLEKGMDETWPADSDVDVVIVFDGDTPGKIGKFIWQGALLEITVMEKNTFLDEEKVLMTHYLAYAMNAGAVLDDPQGFLTPLSKRVQAVFWQEEQLFLRAEAAGEIAYWNIVPMTKGHAPENTFTSCGFGPSAIALPILAEAGRNCTVRRRIPKAKDVLREYGFEAFIPRLDAVMGCVGMARERLIRHMDALERTYCIAMNTEGASAEYPFRSDIRPDAKAVAIDGTRQMLMGDQPEDAVFWMIATFARCMTVLHMDDAAAYTACLPDMQAFAAELGVGDAQSVQQRQQLAHTVRDEAMEIAKKIAAATAEKHKG